MREKKTIEERASETLLETPKVVKVGKHMYTVQPPTLATLMEVSGLLGRITKEGSEEQQSDVTAVAMRRAVEAPIICEAVSVLVLGARRAKGDVSWLDRLRLWLSGETRRKGKMGDTYELNRSLLTDRLLHEVTPTELLTLLTELLEGMELGAFFGVTTFLRELNIAKPTREVVL